MGTLKPQSDGPLYSNTVIGTLAIDRWTVSFGTARRGVDGLRPRPLPSSPNVNTVENVTKCNSPTSYYSMWQYNCLCTLKG